MDNIQTMDAEMNVPLRLSNMEVDTFPFVTIVFQGAPASAAEEFRIEGT